MSSKTKGGLSIPEFYSLNASIDPIEATSELQQKRVNSVYGKASLSWASTYFLDVTGRNDWSSTLSSDQRSYFYPSVSGSIVLSEIVKLPTWWDFLKVRASWTTAKEDAKIYANNNVYSVSTNVWDGLSTASYPSSKIGGQVRPKKSEVWEVGTATNMFKNRLFLDFSYYRKGIRFYYEGESAAQLASIVFKPILKKRVFAPDSKLPLEEHLFRPKILVGTS